MAIERRQLPVGKGFDPENQSHVDVVMKKLADANLGTGWQIQSFEPETGQLTVLRRGLLTKVAKAERGDSYRVELDRDVRAGDGEKTAAMLESDPAHEGHYMTRFDPHLLQATLSKLTKEQHRARSAIATVLGVKPWDVQVSSRRGGGHSVSLPDSYVPSKHDEKLDEAAEVAIGQVGWYFRGNANTLTGEIIPSKPASFPPVISYPMDMLPSPDPKDPSAVPPIPLGMILPHRGDEASEPLFLDVETSPHFQVGGTSGAGKTVAINGLIAGALSGGAELAIIDVPQKAVDFESWKPYCRPGGWGCESFQENAIALEQLYKEGEERASTLKRYGAKKLADLPSDMQAKMRPVLIVVDEVTGLFAKESVPKALPMDHPLRMESESRMLAKELIKQYIEKIAAEQRFVGYKLVLSTQVASTDTGIGTALRTNLGNKALLGARATDGNRKLILRDPTSVPQVPDHVKTDPKASRGVGVSEFEGQEANVFKSFYASEESLIAELRKRGVRPHPEGEVDSVTRPDPRAVAEMFPELAEITSAKVEQEAPKYGAGPRQYESWELDPETGAPLDARQRANMARHMLAKSEA